MTGPTFFALLGTLLLLGAGFDKVTTATFRQRVSELLLSANRRTFTAYVAGTSLAVYAYVFDHDAMSWRFFGRSVLLTIVFVALGLLFLFVYFPQMYFYATSSFRSVAFSSTTLWIVIPPLLVIVFFDYLCNAQTKFFLSLMASSPSLSRFLVIGYADLVATASLAITGLALAYSVFLFGAYQIPVADIRIVLDFSNSKYFAYGEPAVSGVGQTELPALIATIKLVDLDQALNQQDDHLISTYPATGGARSLDVVRKDGVRIVRYLNERGGRRNF